MKFLDDEKSLTQTRCSLSRIFLYGLRCPAETGCGEHDAVKKFILGLAGPLGRRVAESGCEIPVRREAAACPDFPRPCCGLRLIGEFVMSAETIPSRENSLLSVPEAARRLGVCRRTLERLVAEKKFPPRLKIGRRSLVAASDVETFVANLKTELAVASSPSQ